MPFSFEANPSTKGWEAELVLRPDASESDFLNAPLARRLAMAGDVQLFSYARGPSSEGVL